MIRPKFLSISLTFKSHSTAVVLVTPLSVGRRVLWNRVCLSFYPAICLGVFISFFKNVGIVLETLMELYVTELNILEKILPQKLEKWAKTRVSLNIKKRFVINFHWTCSIIKIYVICCVPAKIPYLGRILLLRYRPKYSLLIRLMDFQINYFSRRSH